MLRLLLFIVLPLAFTVRASAADVTTLIAFAQDNMANDFRRAQVYEVRDALSKHPEIRFEYSDAQGHTALLIQQIDNFVKRKVDVLIVGTNDENAVVPIISEAHKSGIPVIVVDRGVNTDEYTTFINSDNMLIGKMGAEYIAERLNGRGSVLLFEGLPNADVTKLRSQGFLDEIAKHEGLRVVRRTGNYLRRDAVLEFERLMAAGEHVDAIFSESDSMLSGVRAVLAKYEVDPSTIVMIGCDYTSEARESIRAGSQTGSVLFPLGGKESAAAALDILAGKPVPKHIVIPVKMVTRMNVEKVQPVF